MRSLLLVACCASLFAQRVPLEQRIAHTDPSKYRSAPKIHQGPGELQFMGLLDAYAMNTNLIFLHRGVIPPGGGIGHHFHNKMEEMFVIFDNEAEFTIDGRTSKLQGPAGAPCRMTHSHAIVNNTNKPTEWMNIAVGTVKGKYDAFDLGDDRMGVAIDPKPVFITMKLDKALLKPQESFRGGKGTARYRRALTGDVFTTNWAYMDHLLLPPGASVGKTQHEEEEEIYYVMNGAGTVQANDATASFRKGDAVPILLGETSSFTNNTQSDLEFMIIGIARRK